MEPEALLPFSQAPAACPSPELDQSGLCLPIASGPFLLGFLTAPNDSNGMISIMTVHLIV